MTIHEGEYEQHTHQWELKEVDEFQSRHEYVFAILECPECELQVDVSGVL